MIITGTVPFKTADERCKIVFNIRPNGLIKIKLREPAKVTPSNKLVPYDEGVSDDSEGETDHPKVACITNSCTISEQDSSVCNSDCLKTTSDSTDVLLSETMIQNEPTLLAKSLSENDCSSRLIPDTMSLDDEAELTAQVPSNGVTVTVNPRVVAEDCDSFVHVQPDCNGSDYMQHCLDKAFASNKTKPAISVSSNAKLTNETALVDAVENSCADQQTVNRTAEHRSKKRKHHRHKKSKSEKRRRRTSVSESDSSDEMEYVWVEKSIVNVATQSSSQPGHSGTTQSVAGKFIISAAFVFFS